MPLFRKPSAAALRAFLDAQARLPFTYAAVGATATTPPAGYAVNRTRVELGRGEAAFAAACAALRNWEQFRLGWVETWPPDAPLKEGEVVAVMGRAMGLWWLNACRVVYVVDETTPAARRFGFAYGTLPAHVVTGEERFLVEWDLGDDRVWYEILAFSKPWHLLTRLGAPYLRRTQTRGGRALASRMQQAVAAALARQGA